MGKAKNLFHYIVKSGFVRTVFLRVISIFIVVSVAIVAIAFFSFTSEIRRNTLSDRQRLLSAAEKTISSRMAEVTSIAYNIGRDSVFYLEPVSVDSHSEFDMTDTLKRYLVGNSFIEHLAYYRVSEPDKIYVSSGVRSLTDFFCTSFGLDKKAAEETINSILSCTSPEMIFATYGKSENSYFSYLYPLPQPSVKPQAFVMMLISVKKVQPLLSTLAAVSGSGAAVFDANGKEIYKIGDFEENISFAEYLENGADAGEEEYTAPSGTKYVLQKEVSETNGWTYVSVLRQSDTLPGIASRQLLLIILLLLLVLFSVLAMLGCMIIQYKPISNLAVEMAEKTDGGKGVINESALLSNTIATLTDDSEQKQKFENAYYEAQAASSAKSTFLSNMSHDIRTPMNAIIGMTAIAMRHSDDAEYVKECLSKVEVSSRYLLDIINNVLDMSRIESGKVVLTNDVMLLPTLIENLVTIIEPSINQKSLHLDLNTEDIENRTVIGDGVRLTQVLVNILSNAVKFTPEGGSVTIGMREEKSDEDGYGNYVFSVSDTGVGMPPEFVGRVFDTFSRADGVDGNKIEGTGLGMAIAKNLVELMGGKIICESRLNEGTVFTITLPMKIATEEEIAAVRECENAKKADADDADAIDLSGRRVLLAEDNEINREIAHAIIAETNAEIVEAFDGKDAVRIFSQKPAGYFDIILMDIQMPVMDGYAATAAIRAMDRADARTIPIYAVTANTFDEDVRLVKESGMNGHIGKPYTPSALYSALGSALLNK